MYKLLFVSIIALVLGCTPKQAKIEYPMTKQTDTIDNYFGHEISDPFRWLEDDMSTETADWVAQQNLVTQNYLAQIPYRQKINQRITKIWDYPKISAPFKSGGHWFVLKNDGLQNQSVVYIKSTYNGDEKVILDPNKLSDDGTVALTNLEVSDDGKYLAYGISRAGSDWRELFVKNIETGELLNDHINWAKFTEITWYNNGFFYSRYPEPAQGDKLKGVNEKCQVYYHKIGEPQANDELIYEDKNNPSWGFGTYVTNDKNYLVIMVTESTSGNALYVKNLNNKKPIVKIVETFDNEFIPIDHINNKLLVLTNYNAPKNKIIAIDPQNPDKNNWTDFIPEDQGVLQSINIIGSKIIAEYLKDAHSMAKTFNIDGTPSADIEFPFLGSVSGFTGKIDDEFTFYSITSFTTPSTIYKYNVKDNTSELFQTTEIDFDASQYETKQVFYTSKDSTRVPMFIVHKKNITLNGNNPVLLYGYGGFNISLTPGFSVSRLIWLEQGGIYAMMNLRGGGEYGEEWHQAGTKLNKQNVFDDCIAAAEYLINEKYTKAGKIALMGGSNGGLLVGAVVNQRPELFGAAIPAVGVMDMLRYHKFTIGRYWATDYGTSEESEEMFKYLLSYSPVHTINEGINYPAIMVTTADHDDRVVPAHSFKYIATLQQKYKGPNPVIIRIETNAGHGAGKPTSKVIDELADTYSFLFYNLNHKVDIK